jgi:mRNA interferase MazF
MIIRGGIYRADLAGAKGHEQKGKARPVLVVSEDGINEQPLVVTVVIGTDAKNRTRSYSTDVRTTAAETGLPRDTVFMCFQIRSLDASRFVTDKSAEPVLAGVMPPAKMGEVERALRRVLDLED